MLHTTDLFWSEDPNFFAPRTGLVQALFLSPNCGEINIVKINYTTIITKLRARKLQFAITPNQ